ncbi:hypothetical protein [Xylophilus sp. GOD-11R]|uniref:hypothetical protein n=1 Tax=Xylophilus sp. GOD-11R TaxID=3089814 RepID=UPI00298C7914|nr:hypothetical protein [Xylophilus sp. GOD-11R]WPB57565.1 hypothetical protein R9X41_02590 [Xylophilus sp. GOD-11R]
MSLPPISHPSTLPPDSTTSSADDGMRHRFNRLWLPPRVDFWEAAARLPLPEPQWVSFASTSPAPKAAPFRSLADFTYAPVETEWPQEVAALEAPSVDAVLDADTCAAPQSDGALLARCARHGWGEKAIEVISRMLKQGNAAGSLPTDQQFEQAQRACLSQPALALKLFYFMVDKLAPCGLVITTFNFNKALEACCRARRDADADRLFQLLQSRGNKPDMKTLQIMLCVRPPEAHPQLLQMAVDLHMLYPHLGYDGKRNVLDLRRRATRPRYSTGAGSKSLVPPIACAIIRTLHGRGLLDRGTHFELGARKVPELTRYIDTITPWLPERRADRRWQAGAPEHARHAEEPAGQPAARPVADGDRT